MTTIKHTRDYNLFHKIEGNRKTRSSHIKSLVNTLAEKPHLIQLNPILVDKNMGIVDGQHRFEAIKELSQQVYYIKGDNLTLDDVQSLNAGSKNWTPNDFAKSFAELGDENYKIYLEFKSQFGLNHDVLLDYLSLDAPMTPTAFKKGFLKVTEPISRSYELARCHQDVGEYYKGYKRRSFALAFHKLWDNKDYDQKRMLDRMHKYGHEMQDYALPNDYFAALVRIYNKNMAKSKLLYAV